MDGVASITLVDADANNLANAADGVSLNAISDNLTNGATMSFSVEDSATNLSANAANLNLADDVSVGATGDNDLTVSQANNLNSIANYDHAGGYTITDDAAAVAGSSTTILGDSDSVTVTGVADATQGVTINGFEGTLGTITFNVRDNGDGLHGQLGQDRDLSHADAVELTNNDGSLVLDITSNIADTVVT